MITRILLASAAALIPACRFGSPIPAWGEEEGAFPAIGVVDNEVLPDFGGLKGNDGKDEVDVVSPPGTDHEVKETPPAKKDEPQQNPNPPAKPQEEEPVPERKEAEKPGEKPPEVVQPPKKEEKAPEQPAKPLDDGKEKPGEKPPEKKDEAPAYDADKAIQEIEGIQIKPNASQKTQEGFAALKAAAKRSAEEAKRLAGELKTAKVAPAAAPEEVTQKLTAYEKQIQELEHYRATRELGEDPKLKAEYTEKIKTAEDKLFDFLVNDPAMGLPKDRADKLREMGLDTPEGREALGGLLDKINTKVKDPMAKIKAQRLIEARFNVTEEHQNRLAELQKDAGGWQAKQEAEKAAETKKWAEDADKHVITHTQGMDWAYFKKEPDTGSTPEIKAKVEAHNKAVKEVYIPKFQETIGALNARDPETAVKSAIAVIQNEVLTKQLADKDAEIAALKARQAELEEYAGGVRQVQRRAPSGTPDVPLGAPDLGKEQSSDEAIDLFLNRKG